MQHALKRLKPKRLGGPDNLAPEHVKRCGQIFVNWLCKVYNCICEIEEIPACFKQGIVTPSFKSKGRNPLLTKSYCGIILTSVLAKVFVNEILLLNRMHPIFDEAGVPQKKSKQPTRKGVGCMDSIFLGKEAISRFTAEGDFVYSCFHDLASAFDTVEFCMLLEQLSHAGVKGKCWRLIKDWHKNLTTQVRLDNHLSSAFPIQRGICQGSAVFRSGGAWERGYDFACSTSLAPRPMTGVFGRDCVCMPMRTRLENGVTQRRAARQCFEQLYRPE